MATVNKAILIGHLGADPELRYTQSGKAVCNFRIATSEKWTDAQGNSVEKTEWHNIVVWDKSGEACGQYLYKGSQVYVEGRITQREWTDKDGAKRYTTEISAINVTFLSSKSEGKSSGRDEEENQDADGWGEEDVDQDQNPASPAQTNDVPF